MTAQENFVGGWTPYHPLSSEDAQVFEEAIAGVVGVKYTPKEVSTQEVNGMNYRYLTEATLPGSPGVWNAIVQIYAPTNNVPHITQIIRY